MQTTDPMLTVTCSACSASFQAPREAVGPNGCKARCPGCSGPLLLFPDDRPVPIDAEPTTVDIPLTPAGLPVHPVGSVPPRRKRTVTEERPSDPTDAPDPWVASTLSVTPPPPRRYGGTSFSTTPISSTRLVPLSAEAIPIRMTPPPRTATGAPPRIRTEAPPRRPGPTAATEPRAPVRRSTQPPVSPRAVTAPGAPRRGGFAVSTQPQLPNRTGPTDGASPSRRTAGDGIDNPISYAPPWGAQQGWGAPGSYTGSPATPVGVPHPTATPAPGPFSAWASPYTHPGVTGTHPGAPTMTPAPGAPLMMSYGQPWGVTAAPVGARWDAPITLERKAVVALLVVVLVVGIAGSLLGAGGQRLLFADPSPAVVHVPVPASRPLEVLPPLPRWEPEPRLPQLQARPAPRRLPDLAPPTKPAAAFSVESSDVRDPWADE